jgi:hypothetical protein
LRPLKIRKNSEVAKSQRSEQGIFNLVRRYFRCLNLFKKLTRRRGDFSLSASPRLRVSHDFHPLTGEYRPLKRAKNQRL